MNIKFTNTQALVDKLGKDFVNLYKGKLKEGDSVASGKLLNSVKYKITTTSNGIKLVFSAKDYWIDIENGRKPKSDKPELKYEDIKKWVIAKNITPDTPDMNIKTLAYIITRSIWQNGIIAKPYFKETQKKLVTSNIIKQLEIALNKDLKEMLDEQKNK